jgi:hypothetical protein
MTPSWIASSISLEVAEFDFFDIYRNNIRSLMDGVELRNPRRFPMSFKSD